MGKEREREGGNRQVSINGMKGLNAMEKRSPFKTAMTVCVRGRRKEGKEREGENMHVIPDILSAGSGRT